MQSEIREPQPYNPDFDDTVDDINYFGEAYYLFDEHDDAYDKMVAFNPVFVEEDVEDDAYYADAAGGKKVLRLLLIAFVVVFVIIAFIYGVLPFITEMLQPDLPPLPPAVQT